MSWKRRRPSWIYTRKFGQFSKVPTLDGKIGALLSMDTMFAVIGVVQLGHALTIENYPFLLFLINWAHHSKSVVFDVIVSKCPAWWFQMTQKDPVKLARLAADLRSEFLEEIDANSTMMKKDGLEPCAFNNQTTKM